jgi:hypothetical protein
MTNEETAEAIQFLNDTWAQKPMAEGTARIWGAKLSEYPHSDIMRVLSKFAYTAEWRPALAAIVRALEPDTSEQASAAFASVRSAFIHPPGDRNRRLTPSAQEAVRRLGGWGVIGQWKTSNMGIHQKEFERVYSEINPDRVGQRRALLPGDVLRRLKGGE